MIPAMRQRVFLFCVRSPIERETTLQEGMILIRPFAALFESLFSGATLLRVRAVSASKKDPMSLSALSLKIRVFETLALEKPSFFS